MAQKGRRNADHKLLMAFACGATVESAARQASVSESTAQRRLDDPAFRKRLQAMQGDMLKRTAGALTAASTESVRTLLELQKPSAPPAVRLGAARSILEIGIKLREAAGLEDRLSALEQQLGVADACRPRALSSRTSAKVDTGARTMTLRTMAKKLGRLEALARRRNDRNTAMLEALSADPVRILTDASMEPDSWQADVLRSDASRLLLLASRQAGKSSVAAALALQTALLRPRAPVLLLSPSLRQSGELYRKVVDLFGALGRPMGVTAESALRLELANGNRVVSLPGDEKNIRGFSGVALLIIDEAARVADSLYYAVRPMLAVSKGRLVALSTPFGKRGWYHDEWYGEGDWQRVKITADDCPRISPEFLAEERRALGERWYRQEYLCSFEDTIDAVFSWADIQAALSDDVKPLFPEA